MKILTSTLILFSFSISLFAQVGINPTGASPHNSAALDVDFPGKGLLVPRMDEPTRDTMTNIAAGLMIYNTTSNCFNMWDGSTWKQSCFDCSFPIPTVGNNGPICEGSTLNLTASSIPGASYAWSGPNGFSSNAQNPSISNASTSANGVYSLQVTLNGCTSNPISTTATVSAIPTTPVVTSNSPVCSGGSLTLGATSSGGASFSWAGPNGYSASGASQTISPAVNNNAGTYTVTADVNGCTSSNSVAVVINDIPAAPTKINGDSIPCANSTNVIYSSPSVMGASSYTWTLPAGGSITSGQGTGSITADFGSTSGNICVSASNTCGTSSQTCEAINLSGSTSSQTFSYTGAVQTFTVPPCVTSVTMEVWGASGGGTTTGGSDEAGRGGKATGTLAVTPGETFSIYVGGQGEIQGSSGTNAAGGWNGGGMSGGCGTAQPAGAGGGSDIRFGGQALSNRIIVAGGGGGCLSQYNTSRRGGSGGGLTGGDCPSGSGSCGGGTQTSGGTGQYQSGSLGQGGNDNSGVHECGGGGGGGYYGGGAMSHGSGGGGSGYISGHAGCQPLNHSSGKSFTNTSMQSGVRHGNGQIVISW